MKTRISYILITGLVLMNLTWILSLNEKNRQIKIIDASFREYSYLANRNYHLAVNGSMCALASNDKLLEDIELKPLPQEGKIRLRTVIGECPHLVLFISNKHCDSCVEGILYQLKKSGLAENPDHLMVIFHRGTSALELWRSRQLILPGIGFFEIQSEALGLPLDSLDAPYLFVAGVDLRTHWCFSPTPSEQNNLEVFINLITDTFANNSDHD